MKKINLSKKAIFRVLIFLFTINVSISVLPGGIVQSYGLFGELLSVSVAENQESGIRAKAVKGKSDKRYKTIINKEQQRVQYVWPLLAIIILSILYLQYWLTFSNYETPVVLKVRMNN